MFFKGIKFYFLFLVCLFLVNSVLRCAPPRFFDMDDNPQKKLVEGSTPLTDAETARRQVTYTSSTSGRTSPKSPQVDQKAAFRAKAVAEETAYLKEVAAYNERMAQQKAFEESKRAQAAQQEMDVRQARSRIAMGRNPGALSVDDYQDPAKLYERTMARQRAAIDVTVQDLNNQVKDSKWILQFLKNERSTLSEDDTQALARNVEQTGEITKKLSELNKRIKQLEAAGVQPSVEQSAEYAFDRMMRTQYPGFGQ